MNELQAFARKWSHPDYPPRKVAPEALSSAERSMGVSLPQDYKSQILAVGLPHPTLALLAAIVDNDLDLHDLSELCQPVDIVEDTHGWRKAGMPDDLIIIGSDSAGNGFCFDERELRSRDVVTAAQIYFWDHEHGTVEHIAPSFPAWIASYLGDWSRALTFKDF